MKTVVAAILVCLLITGCATVPHSIVGEYVTANSRERLILDAGGMFEYHHGALADRMAPGTWESTLHFVILEFIRVDGQRSVAVLDITRVHGIRTLTLITPGADSIMEERVFAEKRPNQSSEPTAMSVTPPAAQEPRQPWPWLTYNVRQNEAGSPGFRAPAVRLLFSHR